MITIKQKLLIGSTICTPPPILNEFIQSLKGLNLTGLEVTFMLIDDNQDAESSRLLNDANFGHHTIIQKGPPREESYEITGGTHKWTNHLIDRVAMLKNKIIDYAIDGDFDYLFFVDADLVLDENLPNHLISQGKEIISEIFWTSWEQDLMPLPNCWAYDHYSFAHPKLEAEARSREAIKFLEMLKQPGVYEVGGLGACTMLSVPALKSGLNFSPIKNVSFWGEDRWFCIRAIAMGYSLYVDTHFPVTHLYRLSDISGGGYR